MKILKLFIAVLMFSTLVSCSKKGYDAQSCQIGNCIGILCRSSTGNSCSSESGCKAVAGGCGGQALVATDIEIAATQHASLLLKDKVIEEYQVEGIKQLVRQILKREPGNADVTK
jgi:hypothetical protein